MRPVMSAAALWTVCLSRYCVSECLVPRKSAWLVRGAAAAYCRVAEPALALHGGPCVMNNTLYNCGDPVYAESINANGI